MRGIVEFRTSLTALEVGGEIKGNLFIREKRKKIFKMQILFDSFWHTAGYSAVALTSKLTGTERTHTFQPTPRLKTVKTHQFHPDICDRWASALCSENMLDKQACRLFFGGLIKYQQHSRRKKNKKQQAEEQKVRRPDLTSKPAR